MDGATTELRESFEDFCDNYCKYPEKWDAEKEGCELSESDVCKQCPINRL